MYTGPRFDLTAHDASGARAMARVLVEVYAEIYEAKLSDPFFSVDRFAERFHAHSSRPGYTLVTACVDGALAGYAYGVPLPPHTGWWTGQIEPLPPEVTRETGERTFALNEIMVRSAWRGLGMARQLHDSLLDPRTEERATLLVEGHNAAARSAYERWGWERLTQLRPYDDAPLYDSMVLDLAGWRARHA